MMSLWLRYDLLEEEMWFLRLRLLTVKHVKVFSNYESATLVENGWLYVRVCR